MEIVLTARLHVKNGNSYIVEYPELQGTVFNGFKDKERFKKQKVADVFGEKYLNGIPTDTSGEFYFSTVTPPDGVSELPVGWQIIPIPPPTPRPKSVVLTTTQEDEIYEAIPEFVSRKPVMH